MINALIINDKDSVCISIEKIKKGDEVVYADSFGNIHKLIAKDEINIYHKIAVKEIAKDEYVIKYGEHIGVALRGIKKGEHVHEHNIEGKREDLEHIS